MNQTIFPDRPMQPLNGRVQTSPDDNYQAFQLYKDYHGDGLKSFAQEAVTNIHTRNDLSNVFFSLQNVETLQDAIRYYVWKKSCQKFVIDKQNENELKIVMRSIYLEYAQHRQNRVLDEVKLLNSRVIEFCVDRILQEIGMYMYYKNDINRLPNPMDRGEYISAKGQKVNEIKSFF